MHPISTHSEIEPPPRSSAHDAPELNWVESWSPSEKKVGTRLINGNGFFTLFQ